MIQLSSPSALDEIPEPLRSALAAARAEPENSEAWAALDEAARECDQPDEASALYQEVLQRDLGAVTLLSLGERAVAFHDEWFDDPDYNIRILKRLTSLDAGGDWVLLREMDSDERETVSLYRHHPVQP